MKKLVIILCVLVSGSQSCSKGSNGSPLEEPDPFKNSPSTPVPSELASGIWFYGTVGAIAYFDRDGHNLGNEIEAGREFQFTNVNGQGRIKFAQYLGMRSSSPATCTTETFTHKEGTVKFEGDKFTFYPVKGSFKTIKKGCSSGNAVTESKASAEDLKPVVYRWDIKIINGEKCLYTYMEDDTDLSDPVFVYSFTN